MAVPIVILVGCLGAGVLAAARYLPELEDGMVGGVLFALLCGMIGAALALVGIHIYEAVRRASELSGQLASEAATETLTEMLWEFGTLLGITAIVFLMAPRAGPGESRPAEGAEASPVG